MIILFLMKVCTEYQFYSNPCFINFCINFYRQKMKQIKFETPPRSRAHSALQKTVWVSSTGEKLCQSTYLKVRPSIQMGFFCSTKCARHWRCIGACVLFGTILARHALYTHCKHHGRTTASRAAKVERCCYDFDSRVLKFRMFQILCVFNNGF